MNWEVWLGNGGLTDDDTSLQHADSCQNAATGVILPRKVLEQTELASSAKAHFEQQIEFGASDFANRVVTERARKT